MEMTAMKPKIVRAGEGIPIVATGGLAKFVISASETNGQFCLGNFCLPPGVGPVLHTHSREDEVWMIVEGTFQFWVDGETFTAGPGDVVFGPRDIPHTFKNIGESFGRFFFMSTGAHFENFLHQFLEAELGTPRDEERMKRLADEYGIKM